MPHDDDASVGVIDVKQPCRPSDPLPRAREQPSHNQRKHSADLMSSMSALGLQTPVTVRKAEDGTFTLLVGHHRYEAARRMGWSELPVIIHDADEHNARLWQLAENLHRKELTVLERSEQIKQWIELAGIDGQVVSKSGPGRPEGLVARAARALPQGRSAAAREKNVRRALLIERIDAQAKEMLRKAGLDDNQQALLEVARQPTAESQAKKAIVLCRVSGARG
jgi:ParB-like chromosome segregation protein Spo0J